MIHGIYMRSKPKNRWHLFSVAISSEAANNEVDVCKKQALANGHEEAQVAVQIFDSIFWIPEYVDNIKEHKPLYN